MLHPYRSPPSHEPARRPTFAADLVLVFLVVWLGSVARVSLALFRCETFGAEPSVAMAVILLVPVLARA
jgi:hypothetical protein